MAIARFPCFECGEPFDDVAQRAVHYLTFGHGFEQVQADALDRARWGVMGDDAPAPTNVYETMVQAHLFDGVDDGRPCRSCGRPGRNVIHRPDLTRDERRQAAEAQMRDAGADLARLNAVTQRRRLRVIQGGKR